MNPLDALSALLRVDAFFGACLPAPSAVRSVSAILVPFRSILSCGRRSHCSLRTAPILTVRQKDFGSRRDSLPGCPIIAEYSAKHSGSIEISPDVARRFILGKQGLWPGRRWRGIEGTEAAMREMEYLQLDPLQIIARSQDITLHSRVLDYTPGLWEELAYQQRKFFDWGGWLAVRPMDELPHWRVVMRRERDGDSGDSRIHRMAADHADAIAEMRAILRERGTVSNRDFAMATRTRTQSYRGRKDSALALYYLWRTGEVMTHHRERFERVYALTETVAPAHLSWRKRRDRGRTASYQKGSKLLRPVAADPLGRLMRFTGAASRIAPPGSGFGRWWPTADLIEVRVEGWKNGALRAWQRRRSAGRIERGRVPRPGRPLDTTTTEEVVFLRRSITSARAGEPK